MDMGFAVSDDIVTCGRCGRSWSDKEHPTPAGRCAFEEDCQSDLERMADAYVADINKLEAGEWPAEYEADNYADEDAVSTWLDSQLEIYADGRRSFGGDGWTIRTVGVLMAYGGPGARFEVTEEGHGTVRVYSWGDEEIRHVHAPLIADRLFDMFGGHDR